MLVGLLLPLHDLVVVAVLGRVERVPAPRTTPARLWFLLALRHRCLP
jgi:hypothetical protein